MVKREKKCFRCGWVGELGVDIDEHEGKYYCRACHLAQHKKQKA